jgi:hypothetical protein
MICGPGRSEVEGVLTRGVLLSAGERGRGDTLLDLTPGGPWAVSASGPERCPAAFFPFSISFRFSFSIFLNCFKSPVLSAILWINDSTIEQNIVFIA